MNRDLSGASPIRVLLVDPDDNTRVALAALLDQHDDIVVVDGVDTAEGALQHVTIDPPDVVVFDQRLPGSASGIFCRRIHAISPGTRCIIHANTKTAKAPTTTGRVVVVLKQLTGSVLVDAIRSPP